MKKLPSRAWLAALFLPGQMLPAFTVDKNVNASPPEEKVVIFEKGRPTDNVTFFDNENCKMTILPDGSLESRIVGNGEVKCGVKWKPRGDLKETFDSKDYKYVIITCRMEGNSKTTQPNGKVAEQRPDNLWFPAVLFNAAGERAGSANLADATENGRTPDQTTKLVMPMILFTFWSQDTSQIQAIGFSWDKTRPNIQRDYRLIIDKIALAN